ncbi:hypothetical protein HELRODRAFT_180344 [Helobdella robusta]|uniref:Uncharacterized protein n=1 Tax=Helobdella robusta TaxID=6412 RepID=T1FFS6_HELRO|nr:hypothetical protein HELRODRAFT_180344 [Helobdella robusta]ESN93937.1 hypothetical protein HELRODRAFT_180344 [Helobdella robusta]
MVLVRGIWFSLDIWSLMAPFDHTLQLFSQYSDSTPTFPVRNHPQQVTVPQRYEYRSTIDKLQPANTHSLENVSFINSVKQFYNLDEFNTGKKVLLNDLRNSKTDNSCFKLTQRANNKYDKLLDIIDIVKFCTDKKVDLPTYVAADFSKIPEPRLEHFLNLFELKFKSLETNLNKRITEIAQMANNLKLNNSTVHSQHVVPITLNARDMKNNTSNVWSDKVISLNLVILFKLIELLH